MAEPNFSPARTTRAYELIVQQIESAILAGELPPGSRLSSERDLMEQFQVSRSTVREALRVITSDGYIRSRPGDPRGAEVLPFSPTALNKQLTRMIHLDAITLSELVQFRVMTDVFSCRLAARLRSDDDLMDMRAALDGMADAVDAGPEAFSEADLAFHRTIARASGNRFIDVCMRVVRSTIIEMMRERIEDASNSAEKMRESVAHDRRLFAAIEAGEADRAGTIIHDLLVDYYSELDVTGTISQL